MKVYLVRHGETEWNRRGLMQGKQGVSLNVTGKVQVEKLRQKMSERGLVFDVCYSSPLRRAVETAEILVSGKCRILQDARLVERGFGVFEGKSMEEFIDSLKGSDTLDRRQNYSANGIEPIWDVLKRAEGFLIDLKRAYRDDEAILVVAHGSLLRALHFEITGFDDETDFHKINFENAEMREYEVQ